MKYLKTFEANSHWKDPLFEKLKFERKEDLTDLLYTFTDMGMSLSINGDYSDKFKNRLHKVPGTTDTYSYDIQLQYI